VRIYRALEKWELMQVVARQLALSDPQDVDATINWAFAVRRADCIESARLILSAAVERLPGAGLLHYELARLRVLLAKSRRQRMGYGRVLIGTLAAPTRVETISNLSKCGDGTPPPIARHSFQILEGPTMIQAPTNTEL
jgi:hypothetical protein